VRRVLARARELCHLLASWRIRFLQIVMVCMTVLWTGAAFGVGTPAGVAIDNVAQLTYASGGSVHTASSRVTSFHVHEVISVRVSAPSSALNVLSPDQNKALVFLVTNVGNGTEAFHLSVNFSPAVADQFNPVPAISAGSLFLDVNGNGVLDVGVDTPVTGPITLNADQSARVLVVSDIPAGRNNGDQGVVTLSAASATPGAAGAPAGTILLNAGTPSGGTATVDAVIGVGAGGGLSSGASDTANGVYTVSSVSISIAKALLAVTSPAGVTTTGCNAAAPPAACTAIIPGTVVTYRITLIVTGSGVAREVLFTDAIPANTTWVPGSMRVDGAARSDAADGDNAACAGCGNATGVVQVNFGDISVTPAAPASHTIDYQLTIN
jgi:uncharacterized repeat protein (TIGR01451 family)